MSATVRTFRAPDATAALAAVKAALGPDAVLISTRTVAGGLFRRPEVEVVAAVGAAVEDVPGGREGREGGGAAREPFGGAASRPVPVRYAPAAAAPIPAARPEHDPLASEVQLLRRSVEEARRALATVTREARAGHDLQLAPAAAEIHGRLIARGVEPLLAEELVRQALLGSATRAGGLERAVRDLLGQRLVPCRAPWMQ